MINEEWEVTNGTTTKRPKVWLSVVRQATFVLLTTVSLYWVLLLSMLAYELAVRGMDGVLAKLDHLASMGRTAMTEGDVLAFYVRQVLLTCALAAVYRRMRHC